MKHELIQMAREAGGMQMFTPAEFGANSKTESKIYMSMDVPTLERFATLVRNATLEEAAEKAVDAVAFNGGTVQMEAHVRQAIRNMKDKT